MGRVGTLLLQLQPAVRVAHGRLRAWWPVLLAVAITAAVTGIAALALLGPHVASPPRDENLFHQTLPSKVLDEDRRLLIHLPDGYAREPARRYPVLYVLDGGRQDLHTDAAARVMARIGVMPEIIVVGLRNGRDTRWRDYTPPYPPEEADAKDARLRLRQADRFLQFMESEVIPYVEGKYRGQAPRMIAGHSLGGLFVLYSLVARPSLFQARFAYSPSVWISENRLRTELEKSLGAGPAGFLYLSLGERETTMRTSYDRLTDLLQRFASPTLRWRSDITRGAEHWNNDALSTPVALQAYYHP